MIETATTPTSTENTVLIHEFLKTIFGAKGYLKAYKLLQDMAKGVKAKRPVLIYGIVTDNEINTLQALFYLVSQNDKKDSIMYHPLYLPKNEVYRSYIKLINGHNHCIHIMRQADLTPTAKKWLSEDEIMTILKDGTTTIIRKNKLTLIKGRTPIIKTDYKQVLGQAFSFIHELTK